MRWVLLELTVTAATCTVAYYHRDAVMDYATTHTLTVWGLYFATLVSLLGLFCTKTRCPRLSLFTIFLLSMSAMIATCVLQYSPRAILMASLGTWGVSLAAAGYSHYLAVKGESLEFMGPALGSALWIVIILGIFNYFVQCSWLETGIAAATLVVFTCYLAYDLNRLYLGKDANDPMMKDGLIASIEIYLDIINMFLSLLQLVGGSED